MAGGRLAYLRFALLVPFAAPLLLSLLSLRQPSPSDSSNTLTQAIANAPARAQRYVQDAQAVVSLAIRAVAPQATEALSPSVPPVQVALAPETHSTDGNLVSGDQPAGLPTATETSVAPFPLIITTAPTFTPAPAPPAAIPTAVPASAPLPTAQATPTPAATPIPAPQIKSAAPPSVPQYTVLAGDQIVIIADQFGVGPDVHVNASSLTNPDRIQAGPVLSSRTAAPNIVAEPANSAVQAASNPAASADRIIPDSEAVYGPAYAKFDVGAFALKYQGYLTRYSESVDGTRLSGPEIVQLVAERFSVGPRVLLTLLEMHGGWVTARAPRQAANPFGVAGPSPTGLYPYLFYTASYLNAGYYGRVAGGRNVVEFRDGRRVTLAPSVNPGTAAVQMAIGYEVTQNTWQLLIGATGFRATYERLFGDPMQFAVEPLIPADLTQPPMRLPFEDGMRWFYTGGPHAAWADGSARAALDFGAPDRGMTCMPSEVWVIAAAAGRVVASEHGRVMVNLDGGNFQGSGWTVMYMHMATNDRATVGTQLAVADHIGHASCEGGASTATHLHFARMYNGQWIPAADKQTPLNLSGWVAKELPREYDGYLSRNGELLMADAIRSKAMNAIYGEGIPPNLN